MVNKGGSKGVDRQLSIEQKKTNTKKNKPPQQERTTRPIGIVHLHNLARQRPRLRVGGVG